MEKITAGKNKIVYKFTGFRDLADHATKVRKTDLASSRKREGWCKDFYTTNNFGSATNLMVDGWDGPLQQIDTIRDGVRQRIGTIDTATFRFDHAYTGGYLDVDSYLAGDPACMLQAYEDTTKRSQKFVRILVDTTYSASVQARDIQVRGAAIVALCDTLNLCGYTTEVWAVSCNGGEYSRKGGSELAVMIPVQGVGEPWDVRSAFFPLAHGDFLRRIVFGVMEGMTASEREAFGVGAGYGTVTKCTKGSLADVHCGGADVICESQVGSIDAIVKDPIKWVLNQCKNLGVLTDSEVGE